MLLVNCKNPFRNHCWQILRVIEMIYELLFDELVFFEFFMNK